MAEQKTYANGLFAKKPHPKAPKFVIASLSFNVEKFTEFLKQHGNAKGYVNIQLLDGKDDRFNAVLDTWEPNNKPKEEPSTKTDNDETLPF